MTLTRGHSCVLCQQRKIRCDRQKPCANCVKAQVECRVVPSQAPRRRARRPQELYLIQRLKKYEAYMSQHGLDPQSIADSEDDMEVAGLENELGQLKASLEENAPGMAPHKEDKKKSVGLPCHWYPYSWLTYYQYLGCRNGLHIIKKLNYGLLQKLRGWNIIKKSHSFGSDTFLPTGF